MHKAEYEILINKLDHIIEVVEPKDDTPLFSEMVMMYLKHTNTNNIKTRSLFVNNILPYLKNLTLKELTKKKIVNFLEQSLIRIRDRLKEKKNIKIDEYSGNQTVNDYLKYISAIFGYAINLGYWESLNPCIGIKKKEINPRRVYITDEELETLFVNCGDKYCNNFLQILYYTGQRPSDVLSMKWSDVVDNEIRITQQKTKAKLRIKICGEFEHFLKKLRAFNSEYIIGKKISYSHISREINKIARRVGINFQLRDLRAKTATDLNEKYGLEKAQKLLGHTSQTMTRDVYLRSETEGDIAESIDWKVGG